MTYLFEHTGKEIPSFSHDAFDMDWGFLGLGSDIAASSSNKKRVGIAIRVLEIKSTEEDSRSGNNSLS